MYSDFVMILLKAMMFFFNFELNHAAP
jgi:hypothetical protein